MNIIKTILILLPCHVLSNVAAVANPTDWYEEANVNRPFVRWWWHGSAVDSVGLTYNLAEFAGKGIGGVEITPIYGVKDNEANDIDYLSPKWMEMLGHTVSVARTFGLQVDMNNGTGWPFGGPEVSMGESARKHIVEKWPIESGHNLAVKIEPANERQRAVATVERVIAVNGTERIDVSAHLKKDGHLDWRAPKSGNWTIYALFCGRTFQKVKRAAPGGEGYVVNHYDSVAVKKYLQRFDRAFSRYGEYIPTSFFNDSYEVYGADWTEGILDEFYQEHGYRLEKYLPEFEGEGGDTELRARVVSDYRRTLGRMLYENFTRIWAEWAHSHGATIRNQSHGSPANIIDLYAAVDIPECESFGRTDFDIPGLFFSGPSRPSDSAPAVLKFASSAAHVSGRQLTSAETLTWLTEHFHTSLARCKPEIDQMFVSGVNHIYFHGAPYSPKDTPFPGWLFYASINMSPTNTMWEDASELFRYISRCQAFLSAGSPDNDVLLYFPYDDILHNQGGNPYLMFEIHKMHQRMPGVEGMVNDIISAGYDMDYVSDSLLTSLEVAPDGRIISRGGNLYGAIIVPDVRMMQPQTLRRLGNLASVGAKVIFVGGIPKDVPGLGHLEERKDSLNAIASVITDKVFIAKDITNALAISGIRAEQSKSEGLSMIRRRNEVGGHNYFMAMLKNSSIDGWVDLAVTDSAAIIFDPITGKKGKAETSLSPNGTLRVRLSLKPGNSLLVKTFPNDVEAAPWLYVKSCGTPITLDSGWEISFPKSSPEIEGVFMTDTLTAWTNLPDPRAQINSATARYTTRFVIPENLNADDWILDLGDVRESARITINGTYVGTAWCVPFSIQTGQIIHPGENIIEIEVTNLQANRIRDYEKQGIEWRRFKDANIASVTNAKTFSFAEWPITPSGLNSKVTITPIYR